MSRTQQGRFPSGSSRNYPRVWDSDGNNLDCVLGCVSVVQGRGWGGRGSVQCGTNAFQPIGNPLREGEWLAGDGPTHLFSGMSDSLS